MMPDATLRPEWVVKREERKARIAARDELREDRRRLSEALLSLHSLQFCTDFLRALQFNLDALDDFDSFVKAIAAPDNGPQVYTVTLRAKANPARSFCGTIQFTRPEAKSIFIHPLSPDGLEGRNIALVPLATMSGVGGYWAERIAPLEAMRLAELVAEDIVNRIDP